MSSTRKNVDDRLSRLPEEILSHILSLMPMKFAVQTSILSKRWRYIWMFVTNLDFGDIRTMDRLHSLTMIVDRLLKFCTPSQVKLFRLHFRFIYAPESSVSNWVDELVRLKISELDLQFHQLQLPPSMFTCRTLTILRLYCSGLDHQNVWEVKCPVNLPCLKTLDILVFSKPSVSAFKLISGCPMLESLSLHVVSRDRDEEDYVFNIPTLKRLKLKTNLCVSFTHMVVLHVPNLEYLCVENLFSLFVMEDVSSLVEASVSLRYMPDKYNHIWDEFVKGITGVKSLSIHYPPLSNPFTSSPPIFPIMKHLALGNIGHPGQVLQFLESSPELEQLCIKVDPLRQPAEYSWVEPELVPACMTTSLTSIKFSTCMTTSLRSVKFSICKWWKREIPFLKYMMGNAKVLKTIEINWKNMSSKKEKLLCAEAVKLLPRASRYCEIHFHEN